MIMKNKPLLVKPKKTLDVIPEEIECFDLYKEDGIQICNLLNNYHNKIKFHKDLLINFILSERIKSNQKILSLLKGNYIRKQIKKFFIIKNILETRKKMIEGFKIIQIYYKIKHLIELQKSNFIIPISFLDDNLKIKILNSKILFNFSYYYFLNQILLIVPKKDLNQKILNSQNNYNQQEKLLLDTLYHKIIENNENFNQIFLNDNVKNIKIYDKNVKKSSSDINILKYPSLSNLKISLKKKTLSDLSKMDILNKIK